MIQALEWDSNFFGIKVGKLDLTTLSGDDMLRGVSEINKSDCKLIYVFAAHDEAKIKETLLKSGGILRDEKVTFSMDVRGFKHQLSSFVRSCKGEQMSSEFEYLAFEAGRYSRFRADEQIPRKKFEELYSLWMVNSLNGSFAKEVFIWEEDKAKLGMVSLGVKNNEGWIGLIAVSELHRGKAIGKYLIHQVIDYCQKQGIKILNVQTQLENRGSCAFYEKVGFKISNIEDVYHIWKA